MEDPQQTHPADVSVTMATLFPSEVDGMFFSSWNGVTRYDTMGTGHQPDDPPFCERGHKHTLRGGTIELSSGPRVAEARSQILEAWLAEDVFAHCEWILMLDSDMTFAPDLICALLDTAYRFPDPTPGTITEGAPAHPHLMVLGGLCFAGGRTKMYPTIYEPVAQEHGHVPRPMADYPDNTLLKVFATGGACLLMHRQVIAHMAQPHPVGFGTDPKTGRQSPYPWFIEGVNPSQGKSYGEDVAFCLRAQALGYGVYVDTGIQTGHRKKDELTAARFREYQGAQAPAPKPVSQLVLPDHVPFTRPGSDAA